jgi:hypothetical protein
MAASDERPASSAAALAGRSACRGVNPGEVWQLDDGPRRLVLTPGTYNVSALNRVIPAVVVDLPAGIDAFAVSTRLGTVYADAMAEITHPPARIAGPVR